MLESAIKHFASGGFHSSSMEAIAVDAGISKPMIYAYFGSKQELYVACIENAREQVINAIVEGAPAGLEHDEQLWRGLQSFFRFVAEHREAFLVLVRDAGAPGDIFAEQTVERKKMLVDLIARMLLAAVDEERREKYRADLEVFARGIVGAGESIASAWAADPRESPETIALRTMNFVWQGLDRLNSGDVWRPSGT